MLVMIVRRPKTAHERRTLDLHHAGLMFDNRSRQDPPLVFQYILFFRPQPRPCARPIERKACSTAGRHSRLNSIQTREICGEGTASLFSPETRTARSRKGGVRVRALPFCGGACEHCGAGARRQRPPPAAIRARCGAGAQALRQASVRQLAEAPPSAAAAAAPAEVRARDHVLVAGAGHPTGTTSQCRSACLANAACTSWVYCWQARHRHLPSQLLLPGLMEHRIKCTDQEGVLLAGATPPASKPAAVAGIDGVPDQMHRSIPLPSPSPGPLERTPAPIHHDA